MTSSTNHLFISYITLRDLSNLSFRDDDEMYWCLRLYVWECYTLYNSQYIQIVTDVSNVTVFHLQQKLSKQILLDLFHVNTSLT